MDRPSDPSAYIFEGFWINWTKGRILGSTLTLSNTNSTLLTNLLALFVTMAGSQFWTIVRFTLHQVRASFPDRQSDMLYNKEQVVLRNSTSAAVAAQLFLTLHWASRKDVSESPAKSTPILFVAIFSATFFLIAGAFSNTVADAGTNVLSRSPFCGVFNETYLALTQYGIDGALANPETLALFQEAEAKLEHDIELSVQYAQSCYLMQGTGSSNCDTFQSSRLQVETSQAEGCPFKAEICRPDVDTIVFDTGFINSHADLGINAAKHDRLFYRRVTNCTILDDTKQTTGWINQSTSVLDGSQPTWQIAYANFGPSILWEKNVTYSYSNFANFYTGFAGDWSMSYQLGSDMACSKNSDPEQCESTFDPITELELSDADLNLLYLGFTGTYINPVDDPWFAAHQPYHLNTSVPFLQTTYARDRPISTLACTEQHQVCTIDQCTPLLGYSQVQESVATNIALTPSQNVTFDRVMNAAAEAVIETIVDTLAYVTSPVLALDKRMSESHTISLPLPNDQWKTEIAYWQSISLAQLQRTIVEYGTGQIAAQPQYLLPPSTNSGKWLCQNLMIRSTVYGSFSVLALSLILWIGLAVILLSLTTEQVAAWLWRRLGRGDGAGEIWRDHDMLGEQVWRTKIQNYARSFSKNSPATVARTDSLPLYFQGETQAYLSNEIRKMRRASSQALSEEDCEKLLVIARAYETQI